MWATKMSKIQCSVFIVLYQKNKFVCQNLEWNDDRKYYQAKNQPINPFQNRTIFANTTDNFMRGDCIKIFMACNLI